MLWISSATDQGDNQFLMLPNGALGREKSAELLDLRVRVVRVALAKDANPIPMPVDLVNNGHYQLRLWTTNEVIVRKLSITSRSR